MKTSLPSIFNRLPATFAILLTVLVTTSTAWGADADVKKAQTVFDASHAEIFSPLKGGPLQYGAFFDRFAENGGAIVNDGPITPKALDGIRTYVIAGPAMDVTRDDIVVLQSFVRSGGNLLVLLHIAPPVARLTESFGIVVSNFVIAEQENIIGDQPQDFKVKRFTSHPLTEGLSSVAVYGSWGLMAEKGSRAEVVASTSDKAWADFNRNRALDEDEPLMSYGVIAVAEYGAGKVVVVADDAPFANKFTEEADNSRLAANIIEWFGK
jgi:hypothetical protein